MSLTRVATKTSHDLLISRMLDVQSRVHEAQTQVSTEKKAINYSGIALDAERLVDFENQRDLASRYVSDNQTAELRLNTMQTSVTAIEKTIRDFRAALQDFNSLDLTTVSADEQARVEDIHLHAFEAMKDLESYLNVRIEGRYLFAGGKTDVRPVDVGYDSLGTFQAAYDGASVTYPTTQGRHTASFSMAGAEYGNLTFNAGGTITADGTGTDGTPFSELPVGSTITITGSASNNTTFTITGNSYNSGTGVTTLTVSEAVAAEGPTAAPTVTANAPNTYYQGDQLELEHRLDEDRTMTLGVNASHGAFEKAIRALGLIAQDGLETNKARVDQALTLLNDSLLHDANLAPTENQQDVSDLQRTLGRNLTLLNDSNTRHKEYSTFLEKRIAEIENVDMLEAVTRLNDETTALDISMKTLARVTQLSLANYI